MCVEIDAAIISPPEAKSPSFLAIQEAMTRSVNCLVDQEVSSSAENSNNLSKRKIQSLLFRATSLFCGDASALVAHWLEKKHTDLFSRVFILNGEKDRNTGKDFKVANWENHYMAIVQDRTGSWYSFSPSNYGTSNFNRLTAILKSDSLENLLALITEQEGGYWSTAPQILHALSQAEKPHTYPLVIDNPYVPDAQEGNIDPYLRRKLFSEQKTDYVSLV